MNYFESSYDFEPITVNFALEQSRCVSFLSPSFSVRQMENLTE